MQNRIYIPNEIIYKIISSCFVVVTVNFTFITSWIMNAEPHLWIYIRIAVYTEIRRRKVVISFDQFKFVVF